MIENFVRTTIELVRHFRNTKPILSTWFLWNLINEFAITHCVGSKSLIYIVMENVNAFVSEIISFNNTESEIVQAFLNDLNLGYTRYHHSKVLCKRDT